MGQALAEVLRGEGIELDLGVQASAARQEGDEYVLELDDGGELRGDHLLVATGRRPRVAGSAWRPSASSGRARVPVDERLRAGEGLWAIGDITGIWQLTHVGKYQGEVVADNILGRGARGRLRGRAAGHVHRPQAAAAGAAEGRFSATATVSGVSKTETYTRAYAESNGFLTLLSDGERLTGAYALGPRPASGSAATLAIRARVPVAVLRDTIQPFPTFSEIYVPALKKLLGAIAEGRS